MALGAVGLAGAKGFSAALGKLAAEHAARMLKPGAADRVKTDITPHIEATYRRCSVTKTLLNPLHPVSVLDIYASQLFKAGDRKLDQYAVVSLLRADINHAIITGTGGSGKSIFTKYLWLSLFERSDGRVPVYLELRQLNYMEKFDISLVLHATLMQGKSAISDVEFKKGLARGDFFLILDGFDEVIESKRDEIQSSIMSLSSEYPLLKIVVSSRPDSRFASWTSFHVLEVLPMRKADVVELIQKAEFSKIPKSRFLKKVKSGDLYDRHESFLSNPLLVCMMLLTFSYNYDVPDRMHLFYDQAFEALYKRHDSHKAGGFRREYKTSLSEDVLKRILSYFCLLTYTSEKFEFSKDEAVRLLAESIRIEKASASADDLFSDLLSCVCILIPDGITYTFSHRSFQEYFAAYCLAYVTTTNFRKIVSVWAKRWNDEVIPLLSDMNPDIFKKLYVIPVADDFQKIFHGANSVADVLESLDSGITYVITEREETAVGLMSPNTEDVSEGALLFFALASLLDKEVVRVLSLEDPDTKAVRSFNELTGESPILVRVTSKSGKFHYSAMFRAGPTEYGPSPDMDLMLAGSTMMSIVDDVSRAVNAGVTRYRRESSRKENVLNDLLNLG